MSLTQLRKYYPDAIDSLPSSTWGIMEKIWALDLSEVDSIMRDRYSDFGPELRFPFDMLRSILLSVEVKITSYTKWAHNLKNHLHAILSGFTVGDTPGIGTFYDFQVRLWNSNDKNLSEPTHPSKEKPKKLQLMAKRLLLLKNYCKKNSLISSSPRLPKIWMPIPICFRY